MKLFRGGPAPEADVRPTLLGIVTLMFLLLFFLLTTSSGERLSVVDLRFAGTGEVAALPHTGLVSNLRVTLQGGDAVVEMEVQTTDIAASSTTVERRRIDVPGRQGDVDRMALLGVIERIHAMDPAQERVVLDPDASCPVETLFAVMDVLRGSAKSALFPRITLAGSEG